MQATASPCVLKICYLKELSREKGGCFHSFELTQFTQMNSFEKRAHTILKQEIDFILDIWEDNHNMQNLKVLVRTC